MLEALLREMFRPGASLGVSASAPSSVDASFRRTDNTRSGGKGKGKGRAKGKGKGKSTGKAPSASSSAHAVPSFVPVTNRSHFPTLPTLDAPGVVSDVVECSQDTTDEDEDEPPLPLSSQAKRDARRRRAVARRVLIEFYRVHQPEKATHSTVTKLLQNSIPKLCKALRAKYGTVPEAWRAHLAATEEDEATRKRSREIVEDKKTKKKKKKSKGRKGKE